jgi:hypothetical protein
VFTIFIVVFLDESSLRQYIELSCLIATFFSFYLHIINLIAFSDYFHEYAVIVGVSY